MSEQTRARTVMRRLAKEYPNAVCALNHRNSYELLVATILSAQCTDERVNQTTPAFFKKYPTVRMLAVANQADVEELVRPTGFFRNKAKNLIGMAQAVVSRFKGHIPHAMEDLITVPGVGRKTANVIRSVGMGEPGLPVDTHVTRISRRLGFVNTTDPVKIEKVLNELLPPMEWGLFSLRMIEHGRQVCNARKPKCDVCVLSDLCPSAFTFDA
jgi:endonuclease-3